MFQPVFYLLNTFASTLPGILNVAGLIILLIYLYATIGMQLFAEVAYYGSHDEHSNFRWRFVCMCVLLNCELYIAVFIYVRADISPLACIQISMSLKKILLKHY